MGKKVALSGNFNIFRAKKVLQEYNFYSKTCAVSFRQKIRRIVESTKLSAIFLHKVSSFCISIHYL